MKLTIAIFASIVFGSLYTLFRKYQNIAELN